MVNIKKELKSRSVEEIEDAETEIDLFDQRLGKKRVSEDSRGTKQTKYVVFEIYINWP